ncbi:HNH endonuclease [Gimesia sp.]|uniref:HNH endonuclease n=1 Tax=Gimesia sp. TaxID=2024833 RepID=UPI0032EE2CEE
MTKAKYRPERLSDHPHYFGIARTGEVRPDIDSKNSFFAEITDYKPFQRPVLAKINGSYIEQIPESKKSNYWRGSARQIEKDVFLKILSLASIENGYIEENTNDDFQDLDAIQFSSLEGEARVVTRTEYKRERELRDAAIEHHGTTCKACGFNFAEVYGSHGAGYIQVHHLDPLSESKGIRRTDPKTDLTVLCANCHMMVHRYKDNLISVDELKRIIALK